MSRYIFHLSIPVDDLDAALAFYQSTLGAKLGRRTPQWLDVLLWGHQITLQLAPNEVLPVEQQGQRHFGVTLPWDAWQGTAARLQQADADFLRQPTQSKQGTPAHQAKLFLADPSGNVIEIKAYRDFQAALGVEDANFDSNRQF